MPFSQLGLCPELLQAIAEAKYTTPTPVQAAAIPPILSGQDVQACAQTGSGKTAAFALPMLQQLERSGGNPEKRQWRDAGRPATERRAREPPAGERERPRSGPHAGACDAGG